MKPIRTALATLSLLLGCSQSPADPPAPLSEAPEVAEVDALGLLAGVPIDVSAALAAANSPDASGALGRNRAGYFHVRFQVGVSELALHAARSGDTALARAALATIAYGEAHQLPAGDYALVVPPSLSGMPPASSADLASGISFYLGAVGSGLAGLEAAPWWQQPASASLRAELAARLPGLRRALDYLVTQRAALFAIDERATNRLFHNAVAYVSLGRRLGASTAEAEGRAMLHAALERQAAAGYFIENGGYDSSYNGVSLLKGLLLWAQLPPGDPDRRRLWRALWRAAQWQRSRVLPSGEISTEGNTRVYPGGESFLGTPKQVAAADCTLAFWIMGRLSGEASFTEAAERVRSYYD